MQQTYSLSEKVKQIFILLIPILITQLGMYSMVFCNNIMSGKYNSNDLAGVAIGTSVWNPVFLGLSSILLAVTPICAQRFGGKKYEEVSAVLAHGIYLSFIIAVLVLLLGFFSVNPILTSMHLVPRVQETAHDYLIGLSYGILPLFLYNVLRSFIYALGKTRVVMVILLIALPINLCLNYVLIFGQWGFPELGGAGAGYATSITYWLITVLTAYIVKTQKPYAGYVSFTIFRKFSWKNALEILRIGVPMGLSSLFEAGMFAVVTILVSKFSVATIAAYQSSLNLITFLYMIPLSLGQSLTFLIGYEVGAQRYREAKIYSWLGMGLSILMAIVSSVLVVVLRTQIAGFFSNELEVIHLISQFLLYAIFFHISDAVQVTVQAVLRGYKDVNVAFLTTLIAYWLICLPVGYLLATFTELGATGYWLGLIVGLFAVGICLLFRLAYIQKQKFVQPGMKRAV